jgi:glycine betaine/choline ABC-type transport system substrate-binding protein
MKTPQHLQPLLTSPAVVSGVIAAYVLLLLVLLAAELGVPGLGWLRATNQVLMLLALLFLPFLLLSASRAVRSVSVKLSGQELHLELDELREEVRGEVKQVELRFAGQVGTAEQALWPMLAGKDPSCTERWARREIIIGAKLNSSQRFFAYLLAVWLEQRLPGLRCVVRAPNGGSLKNFADLKHRWIDVYVDYTGTLCQYFNIDHRGKSPQQLSDELNVFSGGIGMRCLSRLGASENYLLVVRREVAEAEGLRTIKDLTRAAGKLTFSADPEFLNRRDGYPGLCNAYDLAFRRIEPCSVTDRYAYLENGQADVFVAYETDPELHTPDLLVLQDSEGYFADYDALPVASSEVLAHIDGLEAALNALHNILSTGELTDLVQKLRLRGSHPAIVRELATKYLAEHAARN